MDLKDLPFLTVAELSEKIRSREVSPVDVVEAYLDRIEALNPVLNSYITVCADEARADAENAERQIAQGLYRGPMHGIPIAVKDQWWTKGVLTTAGSNILRDFVPDEDATVQTRLKGAGAILLGTTNLTEFAMAYTHHYPYGTPTNPWDQTRMPGGSSAGSGSATAAFMCATSLGEDTGGSIRGPAAYCGLAGLRPSQGRVSRYGLLGSCWSMDTIGPMSRTVRDCAITMQAIAGHDPNDAYTWKTPVPPYADLLDGDVRGLRVGIVREKVYSDHVVPEMRDAVLQAGEILQDRGASVQELSFPGVLNGRAIASPITYLEGATVHHARVRGPELHQYDHNMRITLLLGSLIPAQTYYKAQRLREMMRQDFLELMTTVDLLIFPTAADVAPPLTDKPGLGTKDDFMSEMFSPRRTLTSLANVVGAPALSVPCAFKDGLPLGLQIIGRPMEEDLVFRLGHAYQQDTDFHNRRPPHLTLPSIPPWTCHSERSEESRFPAPNPHPPQNPFPPLTGEGRHSNAPPSKHNSNYLTYTAIARLRVVMQLRTSPQVSFG